MSRSTYGFYHGERGAMIYRVQGQFAEAITTLHQVVALDAQVQHPDLEGPR
jgi:hypothetical protein